MYRLNVIKNSSQIKWSFLRALYGVCHIVICVTRVVNMNERNTTSCVRCGRHLLLWCGTNGLRWTTSIVEQAASQSVTLRVEQYRSVSMCTNLKSCNFMRHTKGSSKRGWPLAILRRIIPRLNGSDYRGFIRAKYTARITLYI